MNSPPTGVVVGQPAYAYMLEDFDVCPSRIWWEGVDLHHRPARPDESVFSNATLLTELPSHCDDVLFYWVSSSRKTPKHLGVNAYPLGR